MLGDKNGYERNRQTDKGGGHGMKIVDVKEQYLVAKEIEGVSEATARQYETTLNVLSRWLTEEGITEIDSIDPAALRAFLAARGVKAVTRGVYTKIFRSWFNWCIDEGILDSNPMKNIPQPKTPDFYPYVLTDEELLRLIRSCRRQPRNHAMIILMLDTGIRVSELCAVEMKDLDLEGKTLNIRSGKGGKGRMVYLSDASVRALRLYLKQRPGEDDNALFLSWKSHKRMERCAVGRMVSRLGGRAGIPKDRRVSPHTLRHCFATRYVRNGGDSYSLQRLLGHSTPKMASLYVNLVGRDIQEIHERCSPLNGLV